MKYLSIDEFLDNQDPIFLEMIYLIRKTLMSSHPKMKEKISFNTIFFESKKDICYIGKIHKKLGIEVGFLRGFQLSNEQGLLDSKGRAIISGITFRDIHDLREKEKAFKEIIQEALILDEINEKHAFSEVFTKKKNKTKL